MLKKCLIGGAVVATLGAFIFGANLVSYCRTAGSQIRESVRREVPVGFEIKRARDMVNNLVPDIQECMHVIAEQKSQVKNRRVMIAERTAALETQKEQLMARKNELSSGQTTFVIHQTTYSVSDLRRDLETRFHRYTINEGTLKSERQILEAREKALASNQEKLQNMWIAKRELEVQIEQLEARLHSIEARETISNLEFDSSQLSRAKKLIQEVKQQLDVKEELLNTGGNNDPGLIPIDSDVEESSDIAEQIEAHFGSGSKSSDLEQNLVELTQE